MGKKISIVDIAKALNISKSSVSFILNGHAKEKRISDELVERVTKYVNEVGYKPNSFAQSLRTGKSNTIGLMVEDISNPFFAKIARLIEDRAYENGYKMIYSSTDNNTVKTQELISMFRDRHVDGYIIAPPEGIEDEINALLNDDLPVVLFDRYLSTIETDHVVIDNKSSVYNVTTHLIEQGYKNIGFISFTSVQIQLKERLQGYKDALKDHNMKSCIKEVMYSRNESLMYESIVTFLKKRTDLDSVIFSTNHLGVLGLKAIRTLGLKIPNDIAVASFDDYELFELTTPPITAIAQPIEAIADNIITILLNKLNAPTKLKSRQNVILSTDLKIRESTSNRSKKSIKKS